MALEKGQFKMNTIIDITSETQAVVDRSESLALQLQTYKVTCQDEYNTAGEHLKSVKNATKQLDDLRMSMTKPLDESKKRIMDFFRKPQDILTVAEGALKRSMLAYQQEQERKRREEEARLQEKARREAERLAARAEKADANGNAEKAAILRQEAQEKEMAAPVVESRVEKVAGVSTKKVWKFEIINEDLIPREYMTPDEARIGKVVRATTGTMQIPGVRIYSEDTLAARG